MQVFFLQSVRRKNHPPGVNQGLPTCEKLHHKNDSFDEKKIKWTKINKQQKNLTVSQTRRTSRPSKPYIITPFTALLQLLLKWMTYYSMPTLIKIFPLQKLFNLSPEQVYYLICYVMSTLFFGSPKQRCTYVTNQNILHKWITAFKNI
jgi:hypothetical protein